MMRLGPDTGLVVVLVLPLFEEANRTRAVVVAMMRALGARGIASVLPELPGQGESSLPTSSATLVTMRAGLAAVVAATGDGAQIAVAAIRSGALLDVSAVADRRWHWSPQDGVDLARELGRVERAAGSADVGRRHGGRADMAPGAAVSIGGNLIAPDMLVDLPKATTSDVSGRPPRVVRLDGDPRSADRYITGSPPWRRAEPTGDTALSETLAADIAEWLRPCVVR